MTQAERNAIVDRSAFSVRIAGTTYAACFKGRLKDFPTLHVGNYGRGDGLALSYSWDAAARMLARAERDGFALLDPASL